MLARGRVEEENESPNKNEGWQQGRLREGHKQPLEHEQIKGTGWDERHTPTDTSSSQSHLQTLQGRRAEHKPA